MSRSERGAVRRSFVVLAGVLLLVGVWFVVAVLTLLSARDATADGIDALESARDALTPERVVDGEGLTELQAAREHFEDAHDRIRSPWMAPMRVVPVLGRQVRSADALTGSATDVVDVGIDALEVARAEFDRAADDGPARVALTARVSDVADDTATRLRDVDLGPSDALISSLEQARARFARELDRLRGDVERLRDASHAFTTFLGGPSRYLVLASNNNEMRNGAGSPLSVGVLEVTNGSLAVSPFEPSGELEVPDGAVEISGDLADRWGWLEPEREWRNLMSSPRFDAQAELASRMWSALGNEPVDGVMLVDPVALRGLLRVTGPITVDGVEYTSRNVLDQLYVAQYRGLEEFDTNAARRERLAVVARAALERLESGGWDAEALLTAMREVVNGRHLLLWAADAGVQRGWVAAEVDGQPAADALTLALHNRGGNKLDRFLEVAATMSTVDRGDRGIDVEIEVDLTNVAYDRLPTYVEGPFPGSGGAAGLYQGLFVVQAPAGVTSVEIRDGSGTPLPLPVLGPDGDQFAAAAYVEVPRGEARSLTVRFTLPADMPSVVVEPSARFPAIDWRYERVEWADNDARRLTFSQ